MRHGAGRGGSGEGTGGGERGGEERRGPRRCARPPAPPTPPTPTPPPRPLGARLLRAPRAPFPPPPSPRGRWARAPPRARRRAPRGGGWGRGGAAQNVRHAGPLCAPPRHVPRLTPRNPPLLSPLLLCRCLSSNEGFGNSEMVQRTERLRLHQQVSAAPGPGGGAFPGLLGGWGRPGAGRSWAGNSWRRLGACCPREAATVQGNVQSSGCFSVIRLECMDRPRETNAWEALKCLGGSLSDSR